MNLSVWFWLAVVPCLLMVLFFWYCIKNVNSGALFDNWAWILLLLSAFCPILSWITFIGFFIYFINKVDDDDYRSRRYENGLFKDNKLNRFLFNSHFNDKK